MLPEPTEPPSFMPVDGSFNECTSDADCVAQPNGQCVDWRAISDVFQVCRYGCTSDEDCPPDNICRCGDVIGQCVSSSCRSDADCGDLLCLEHRGPDPCGNGDNVSFSCAKAGTECRTASDCGEARLCVAGTCDSLGVCGRPFLVDGAVRHAQVVFESAWPAISSPDVDVFDPSSKERLAEYWVNMGLLEHASIAAFARFTLDLLSLGAPAYLISDSQSALGDEVEHARLAFGLASAYAGKRLGPGPLPIEGSLSNRSRLEIVRTAFLEGCIGETCAAVEAAEAAAEATDPAVARILQRIAEDETRHAALSYRFVAWALGADSELAMALQGLLAAELSRAEVAHGGASALESSLAGHGLLSESRRRAIRASALRDVILPCVQALFEVAVENRSACAERAASDDALGSHTKVT